jgi:enoyl-CoA hydratase/carnithine racemase
MPQPWTTVDVEIRAAVAVVILDRPALGNPVDRALRIELPGVWAELEARPEVGAVLLGARGAAFSVGFPPVDDADADAASPPTPVGPKTCGFDRPVVVELAGDIGAGAFGLVGDADTVVAAPDVQFFVPLEGGPYAACDVLSLTPRLPRLTANRLALMGTFEPLSARRAHELGLVDEIVERSALRTRSLARANAAAR